MGRLFIVMRRFLPIYLPSAPKAVTSTAPGAKASRNR